MIDKEKKILVQKENGFCRPVSIGLYEMLSLAQTDLYHENMGLVEVMVEKAQGDLVPNFVGIEKKLNNY